MTKPVEAYMDFPFNQIFEINGRKIFLLDTRGLSKEIQINGIPLHGKIMVNYRMPKAGESIKALQKDSSGKITSQIDKPATEGVPVLSMMRDGYRDEWQPKSMQNFLDTYNIQQEPKGQDMGSARKKGKGYALNLTHLQRVGIIPPGIDDVAVVPGYAIDDKGQLAEWAKQKVKETGFQAALQITPLLGIGGRPGVLFENHASTHGFYPSKRESYLNTAEAIYNDFAAGLEPIDSNFNGAAKGIAKRNWVGRTASKIYSAVFAARNTAG